MVWRSEIGSGLRSPSLRVRNFCLFIIGSFHDLNPTLVAFIGSDVVTWLYARVAGFADRREARKYASQMLKVGFLGFHIAHSKVDILNCSFNTLHPRLGSSDIQ